MGVKRTSWDEICIKGTMTVYEGGRTRARMGKGGKHDGIYLLSQAESCSRSVLNIDILMAG